MEIMNAIGKVLALGCGTSLSKVLRSKRYEALSEAGKTIKARHDANSDTGVALRAGHMEFGRLINTVGEQMALIGAKGIHPDLGLGIELRPLVQITGEKLVQAATRCLNPDIKDMAKQWKDSTADKQVEICRSLYDHLRSTSQDSKGDLTMAVLMRSMESHEQSNVHEVRKVLPKQYGMWNPDSCVANCQGKTQMIIAFARLAKARVIVAHPLKHAGKVINSIRRHIYEKVVADIAKRGLTHLDKPFAESLHAGRIDLLRRAADEYFHVCACIQIADGRWVLIDPHGLNFGIMGEEWNMPEIVERLDRYSEVLPGLHLLATDKGRHERLMKMADKRADELIARSVKLEQHLATASNPIELIDALISSGEIRFMIESFSKHDQEKLDKALTDPEYIRMVAMTFVLGEDMWDPFKIMMDTDFMKKRLHSIITSHHCVAMNELNHQWSEDGMLIHPECEFTNPEYSVAISAINSLVDQYGPEVNRFFMDYSFDQTSMFNALRGVMSRWSSQEETMIGIAAAKSLRALPVQHPLCRRRLSHAF
ncbi:MAG: hypothetical protein WCG02_03845 [Candidatus Taylorbacteria bacterium]